METFYPPPPRPPPSRWPAVAGLVVVALAGAGLARWWYPGQPEIEEVALVPEPPTEEAGPPPLEEIQEETEEPTEPEAVEVNSAPLYPEIVSTWLDAPSFMQRVAAALWRVSKGRSPEKVLGFIEVDERFTVIQKGRALYINPDSFARYNPIIEGIVAVPPHKAAEVYKSMRPQLKTKFAQLATHENFDKVVKRAINRILRARVPKLPIEVVEVGGTYYYADDDTQALNDVTKHLIRIGPDNLKRLRKWLYRFSHHAHLR